MQNATLEADIFECIQEKFIGKVEQLVGNRLEIISGNILKESLIQSFFDIRDKE